MNISFNNNINFGSGLTKQILEAEQKTKPYMIKRYFQQSNYKDWADFYNIDFKNNKACALASRMCADIFKGFRKKHDYRNSYSMQELVFPHDLFVFNENELSKELKNNPYLDFFCTSDGSVFINNKYNCLEELNEFADKNKEMGYHSSGHFLSWFIHEWLHAIQNKLIYNLTSHRGYGNFEQTKIKFFHERKLDNKENEIVEDILGKYATIHDSNTAQYSEVFAEAWTKFICDSLDKDCVHFKKDPVEEMKKTPTEFQKILEKVSKVEFYDIWGNKK